MMMNFHQRKTGCGSFVQLTIAVLAIFSANFIADYVLGGYILAALQGYFSPLLLEGSEATLAAIYHVHEMIVWTLQAVFVVAGLLVARRYHIFGAGLKVESQN